MIVNSNASILWFLKMKQEITLFVVVLGHELFKFLNLIQIDLDVVLAMVNLPALQLALDEYLQELEVHLVVIGVQLHVTQLGGQCRP